MNTIDTVIHIVVCSLVNIICWWVICLVIFFAEPTASILHRIIFILMMLLVSILASIGFIKYSRNFVKKC